MALAEQVPGGVEGVVGREISSVSSTETIIARPTTADINAGPEESDRRTPTASRLEHNTQQSLASDLTYNQNQDATLVPPDIVPPIVLNDLLAHDTHTGHPPDSALQSALFLLPFPAPINAHRSKNTPPFLLYSPPRKMYTRPPKNEEGKRAKEKFSKKLVRIWQQEVAMGEKIKRGEVENPTRFKKIRGKVISVASNINKWLPNSCIETLSRLPPQSKLGTVTLIHPVFQPEVDGTVDESNDIPYEPTPDELLNDIRVLLRKTRKRIMKRAILSSMLLPISLGIDVFAPVFAFEINVTYFAYQVYGLKKAKLLLASPGKKQTKRSKRSKKGEKGAEEATLLVNNQPAEVPSQGGSDDSQPQLQRIFSTKALPSPALDPILVLMYDICARIDPTSFPPRPETASCADSPPSSSATLPPNLKNPDAAVVKDLIDAFKQVLPPDITDRYILDQKIVAEDVARYLKKASKEYIDSLGGRSDRKGAVHGFKTWRKKSVVKKEQAALLAREKRQAKKLKKEALS